MNNPIDPVNKAVIDSQTANLTAFLLSGRKWHCHMDERRPMGIGYSTSRISDIRNKYGLSDLMHRENIKVRNKNGNMSRPAAHWIPLENIAKAHALLKRNHPIFYAKVNALLSL